MKLGPAIPISPPELFWRLLSSGFGLAIALCSIGAFSVIDLAHPQAAHAYTSRSTLLVPRNPGERYDTFLRQSEAIAQAQIQLSFITDPLISEVIVTVAGDNQGIAIPTMEIQVTRAEWQERPDPRYWARYYSNASVLLDL
ncbi:hypothetical protein PN498_24120 [Oscillatoria sp. CS-180]|uniref:hypothetical protein n=1 Tax=Oscillatoria sp. CS-180 TaxID=3021720 RepID=UPI00232FB7EF|nr:hypothetical protein [Oscillatoria sp. CS-180]MDB9529101.1 hypothetical protein [Oscillatoria sp. CS-180]